MMVGLLGMIGAVALGGALSPAPVEPLPSAVERASAAYADERWDDAIAALGEAYAEDPLPKYLYAQAQALRLSGRCGQAVPVYQAFIDLAPPAPDVADARAGIELCRPEKTTDVPANTSTAAEGVASAATGGRPNVSIVPEPPVRDAAPSRRAPWWTDRWGHGLTWSGLVVSVVGAALLGEAHRRERFAGGASDDAAYRSRLGPAPTLSRVAIPVLTVGSAALLAGVVRFIVVGQRRRSDRTAARPTARTRSLSGGHQR